MRTGLAADGRTRRVLVCDDERHVARLIQVNLVRRGHLVKCAYDGRQAIQMLESSLEAGAFEFDCAILDLMVPYFDGFEILKWIRSHEKTKEMWVAIMTVQAAEVYGDLTNGADRLIGKPFNPTELLP
jgi:two-component system alkaline phosphatase synthesis response regulator PhoP/two-component system response regulator VicR